MPDSPPSLHGRRRRRVGFGGRAVRSACLVVAALVAVASFGATSGAAGAEWNIARVGAPASTTGDAVIAVVDTGVDGGHPAFNGRVLPQLDFTGDRQKGDPQGHGTHVAGTAAGGTLDCGNGPSAIGVVPNARILPIRVLDAEGSGRVSDVVSGIRAAADDQRVTVINLSLGGDLTFLDGGGDDFREAIAYAWSKGKIPVLAAGNSGLLGGVFGSGYGGLDAVVVTATTNQDRKAGYASSVGSAKWGIAAPGGDTSSQHGRDVLSAYPGDRCALLGGTSMAAPHVSGALAILRSRGLNPQQAVDRLLETAKPIGSRDVYGAGLVDVAAATAVPAAPPATAADRTAAPTTTAAPTGTAAPSTASATPAPRGSSTTSAPAGEAPTDDTTPTSTEAPPSSEDGTIPSPTPLDVTPGSDEAAAVRGGSGDEDDSPGAGLVVLAVAACVATGTFSFRLRRLA